MQTMKNSGVNKPSSCFLFMSVCSRCLWSFRAYRRLGLACAPINWVLFLSGLMHALCQTQHLCRSRCNRLNPYERSARSVQCPAEGIANGLTLTQGLAPGLRPS